MNSTICLIIEVEDTALVVMNCSFNRLTSINFTHNGVAANAISGGANTSRFFGDGSASCVSTNTVGHAPRGSVRGKAEGRQEFHSVTA